MTLTDIEPVHYVIRRIYRQKTQYLTPRETWTDAPHDAGLWAMPNALRKVHRAYSRYGSVIDIQRATHDYRIALNKEHLVTNVSEKTQ